MISAINPLEVINIASPCHVRWDAMAGDDRVRNCGDCRLNVYNISAMTRDEAESLIHEHEGRLCLRFYRRSDGTILTQDCPVGLRTLRRRLARTLAAFAAVIGVLSFGTLYARGDSTVSGATGPLARVVEWVEASRSFMGVCSVTPIVG